MSRYTTISPKAATALKSCFKTPLKASKKTVNHEGAKAFRYSSKSELFMLGQTNFVSQGSFYENAIDRDNRYVQLVRKVSESDPQWVADFLKWLRSSANIRTASLIGAIEYGRVVSGQDFNHPAPRMVLDSVLQRADEPSEALGYWFANYGRTTPRWLQRGLGDAAKRLYTEFSVLRYDSQKASVRFGDVINLSSVKTNDDPYKATIFRYALDRRYDSVDVDQYPALKTIQNRSIVDSIDPEDRKSFLKNNGELLESAGYTWESLSGWLGGPLDKEFWEQIIPSMGYMALLRNLRNFRNANVSKKSLASVAKVLSDPEKVAKSRVLPLRFVSAFDALHDDQIVGDRYCLDGTFSVNESVLSAALEKGFNYSLASVPSLDKSTVILIDTSGSMSERISERSKSTYYDSAVSFGLALAIKNPDSYVFGYSNNEVPFTPDYTKGILENIKAFKETSPCSGGTRTIQSLNSVLQGIDHTEIGRIVILTDEQNFASSGNTLKRVVPEGIPCITFNLAGYRTAQAEQGKDNFYAVSGLTDSAFQMLANIETTKAGRWPWE